MRGTDLKARLKRTGKTMTEIGALVGMSSQSLNQVFNAQDVKSGILESLAGGLGISIAELYGVPAGDISTTTGNGNITLTGTGNTNYSASDCAALLAAKDDQINRLLGIIERLADDKE